MTTRDRSRSRSRSRSPKSSRVVARDRSRRSRSVPRGGDFENLKIDLQIHGGGDKNQFFINSRIANNQQGAESEKKECFESIVAPVTKTPYESLIHVQPQQHRTAVFLSKISLASYRLHMCQNKCCPDKNQIDAGIFWRKVLESKRVFCNQISITCKMIAKTLKSIEKNKSARNRYVEHHGLKIEQQWFDVTPGLWTFNTTVDFFICVLGNPDERSALNTILGHVNNCSNISELAGLVVPILKIKNSRAFSQRQVDDEETSQLFVSHTVHRRITTILEGLAFLCVERNQKTTICSASKKKKD